MVHSQVSCLGLSQVLYLGCVCEDSGFITEAPPRAFTCSSIWSPFLSYIVSNSFLFKNLFLYCVFMSMHTYTCTPQSRCRSWRTTWGAVSLFHLLHPLTASKLCRWTVQSVRLYKLFSHSHLSPSKKTHLHSSKTTPPWFPSWSHPPWSSDELPISSPSFLFLTPGWSLEHDKDRSRGSFGEINEGSLWWATVLGLLLLKLNTITKASW